MGRVSGVEGGETSSTLILRPVLLRMCELT